MGWGFSMPADLCRQLPKCPRTNGLTASSGQERFTSFLIVLTFKSAVRGSPHWPASQLWLSNTALKVANQHLKASTKAAKPNTNTMPKASTPVPTSLSLKEQRSYTAAGVASLRTSNYGHLCPIFIPNIYINPYINS